MKKIVIKTDEDLASWRKVLSVYVNLYRLRVFAVNSISYRRMLEIVKSIFDFKPYTV